ncbi:UNVERIFIED_CONTAM: hypothetical protein GTU68_035496 [Idotea baltica]|nr:hypothetical protein [Idotea baltica]
MFNIFLKMNGFKIRAIGSAWFNYHPLKCYGNTISIRSSHDINQRQKNLMAKSLPKKQKIPGVQNIVVVASGKGGVGKSTTSVNLALALANIDSSGSVGLLDMDVFGPSIPRMMNLNGKPEMDKGKLSCLHRKDSSKLHIL